MRARDVPDMDTRHTKSNRRESNESDPYMVITALSGDGKTNAEWGDEAKTTHKNDSRHPSWKGQQLCARDGVATRLDPPRQWPRAARPRWVG